MQTDRYGWTDRKRKMDNEYEIEKLHAIYHHQNDKLDWKILIQCIDRISKYNTLLWQKIFEIYLWYFTFTSNGTDSIIMLF